MPPEWRSYASFNDKRWAHVEAGWKWGQISYQAYKKERGHLWDLSKRIQHQISTLNNTFRSLSLAYRGQLNSKIKDDFKAGDRFENGYSLYIYDAFQHFLFDACMLRDYISEFVFHYVVPSELKARDVHMTTTAKIFNGFYKNREVQSDFDRYFKEICGQDGWLNMLSLYRDLVMHACPLSMPKQQVWIRCEATELLGGKLLPRIVAPIPNDPLALKTERNSFEFFRDFQKQADDFFGKSNNQDTSIDLLEYSCVVMDEFSKLLWLSAEQSPLEGEIMSFGPHNIIGDVRTIKS
jgi:hypothetical protein